jgi:hypothetical protein
MLRLCEASGATIPQRGGAYGGEAIDRWPETRYNRDMELVQLKNLFAELKKKATDLRGFL